MPASKPAPVQARKHSLTEEVLIEGPSRKDAQVLSEVSTRIQLPSVHIPSQTARKRKSMCGMREALVGSRTQLVNTVRGWLRTQNRGVKSGAVESFVKRVQALAEQGGDEGTLQVLGKGNPADCVRLAVMVGKIAELREQEPHVPAREEQERK